MLDKIKCFFGLHDYGDFFNAIIVDGKFREFKQCKRCGHAKLTKPKKQNESATK